MVQKLLSALTDRTADRDDLELRTWRRLILAILILSAGLRIGALLAQDYLLRDEISYLVLAGKWSDGSSLRDSYNLLFRDSRQFAPPLLIFIIGWGEQLGLDGRTVGTGFSILMGVLLVLAGGLISRRIWESRKAGLYGMLFLALNPYLVMMSCRILRDPAFWTIAAFLLLALLYPQKTANWAFAGALCVLGMLFRREGSLLPCWCLAVWLAVWWQERRSGWIYRSLAVFLVIFSLMFIPCYLFFREQHYVWPNWRIDGAYFVSDHTAN